MSLHPRLVSIFEQLAGRRVRIVRIALGGLFPLTEDQIRSQWDRMTKDTSLANAQVIFRVIPAQQQCMVCFKTYHPRDKETSCPYCGSAGAKILSGEEFYLESFEAENG